MQVVTHSCGVGIVGKVSLNLGTTAKMTISVSIYSYCSQCGWPCNCCPDKVALSLISSRIKYIIVFFLGYFGSRVCDTKLQTAVNISLKRSEQ